jgi:hypothetical protein
VWAVWAVWARYQVKAAFGARYQLEARAKRANYYDELPGWPAMSD